MVSSDDAAGRGHSRACVTGEMEGGRGICACVRVGLGRGDTVRLG